MIFNNIYVRSLVLAICYLGALCFAYLSFYSAKPKYQKLLLEEKEVNYQKEQLDAKLKSLQELENLLKEKTQVLELFSLAFPKDDTRMPEILVELDNLSQLSGIKVEDLQINLTGSSTTLPIGKPTKEGETAAGEGIQYGSVPITLTIKGSISQVEAFLEELYNNLRVLMVKNFSLEKEGEDPNSNVLTAKIQIDAAYFISQIETTPAGGVSEGANNSPSPSE